MPITEDGRIEYKMPLEIKSRFTKEIMNAFRNEVIETFRQNDIRLGNPPGDYGNETYYGWWLYMEGTSGYCNSFRSVCEAHGLNDVLDYYNLLEWYDADLFDSEIGNLLLEFGLVEMGNPEEDGPFDETEDTD